MLQKINYQSQRETTSLGQNNKFGLVGSDMSAGWVKWHKRLHYCESPLALREELWVYFGVWRPAQGHVRRVDSLQGIEPTTFVIH